MANNFQTDLAEIKGALGVIKSWGLGIAIFVGGIGLASLGYVVSINGDIGQLKSDMQKIKEVQQVQTQEQLADIQAKLNQLIAPNQTPEPTISPEEKAPPK